MLMHVDCNSAYVSWERVFRPDLEGVPTVLVGIAFSLHLRALRCISKFLHCTKCSDTPAPAGVLGLVGPTI